MKSSTLRKWATVLLTAMVVVFVFWIPIAPAQARPQPRAKAQPHMQKALASLRVAERQLAVAAHNKGGHRVKALELVREAIRQVELGIAAGND